MIYFGKKKLRSAVYPVSNRAGFSMLEMLIVVAISAGMIFVISSLRNNVNVLENIVNQRLRSRKDVEEALQTMITDIRSANRSSAGAYPIESAASTSLVIFSDIDRDGLFERVRYTMATTTILRGITKPSGTPYSYPTSTEIVAPIVDYIVSSTSTPLFSYYDASSTGNEAAMSGTIVTTQIRSVKITFGADIDPGKAPRELLFSNTVTIRNLRSN